MKGNTTRKRIIIKIKDFLLGRKNREFLIFLFFFALSAVFWLLQTLNETFETEVVVPLKLNNVPSNLIITSDLPDELHVTVQDKGSILMKYLYGQPLTPVTVDYKNYDFGGMAGRVQVQEAEVRRAIAAQLFSSTRIQSIKPDTLEFFYNRGLKKKVPVLISGVIEPAQQYYLRHVVAKPDSVVVFAPSSILDTLQAAYTQNFYQAGLVESKNLQIPVRPIRGAKFIPDVLDVQIDVDIYTEKTVEVPIVGVNFPADKDLRTFPSKVKVTFKVGSKSYKSITADDFVLVISYEELINNESSKIPLHLKSIPEGVSSVRIHPSEVDYLLEQTSGE
ncbi:YbbR-like domain-containing protein [Bacteroides sp. OF04-15BH]|jgi:hypothetical protein|nr:YbbR-like domain-containing protein [Bacteroides sp. OF04-15BH]